MKTKILIVLFLHVAFFKLAALQTNNTFQTTEKNEKSEKTDANVTGHVVDIKTNEHIPSVRISLKGTTIQVYTDATGHYFLKNLPVGNFTLVAKLVGYKTQEIEVNLQRQKLVEVNFELEEDAIMLESIVVSQDRNNGKRNEMASIVNVLTPLAMDNINAVNLAQGLNFQPGLRVETNCQNCGFQQVRINGLEGPYTQLMIDSRPIFSSLSGVYGLEHIPSNMIEKVEVVRGGGSAIFSSSAIGGTINIITKEPKVNSFSVSNVLSLIGGNSPDNNLSINASLISDDFKTGATIFGTSRQRSGFDYDKDGFTELPQIDSKNIGFRSYYNLNYLNKFTFEYHHINEFRRGGNNLRLPPHETEITEQADHNIHSGSIAFNSISKDSKHGLNAYISTQYVNRKSYFGAGKDPNAYGLTNDKTWIGGLQYSLRVDNLLFMPAELLLGAENNYNSLQDNIVSYNRTLDQTVNISSIFAQNEWKSSKFTLMIGGRLEKHNLIKNLVFSPRLNLRYNPLENINLRAGYSAGYRGPQAYDEELHVSAVGGDVSLVVPNPNLKPEFSNSFTASADFYYLLGSVQTNLLVEGFYTRLKNTFVLEPIGRDDNGNLLFERRSGSDAEVKGVNLEGTIVPNNKYQFQFGFTLQSSRFDNPQAWSEDDDIPGEKRFLRAPNHYGYFTSTYTPLAALNISLSGVYTGSMLVPHLKGSILNDVLVETPHFFDFTLKSAYDFRVGKTTILQLNGGIHNIFNSFQKDFDKGELRDSQYIYGPALPRTLFLGIKYSI
ncbi:MAG: TonB-dependent receptor [Porphyromonadaceae bacterium]|nr:TonB-dependent receptor [Porphyromonadaceae bacterium]